MSRYTLARPTILWARHGFEVRRDLTGNCGSSPPAIVLAAHFEKHRLDLRNLKLPIS